MFFIHPVIFNSFIIIIIFRLFILSRILLIKIIGFRSLIALVILWVVLDFSLLLFVEFLHNDTSDVVIRSRLQAQVSFDLFLNSQFLFSQRNQKFLSSQFLFSQRIAIFLSTALIISFFLISFFLTLFLMFLSNLICKFFLSTMNTVFVCWTFLDIIFFFLIFWLRFYWIIVILAKFRVFHINLLIVFGFH